jgi:hypothetical protein
VDRPVHTILTPEFAENQTGTLHFHYLLKVGGGVLQASRTVEEHHAKLGASLRGESTTPGANSRFVSDFIRPHGLRKPATLIFCDAIENLAKLPVPKPERTPMHLLPVRWAAYPIFLILRRLYGTELFRDDWRRTDPEHQRVLQAREQQRQARHKAAEETKRERERRRAVKTAAREAALREKASRRSERERKRA